MSARRATAAVLRVAVPAFCVAVPLVTLLGVLLRDDLGSFGSYDFEVFYRAAEDMLAGRSPYADPETLSGDRNYVYPPLLALAVVPLTVVSPGAAAVVFLAISLAALACSLRLVGVRDWRCYALSLAWWPLLVSLEVGSVGLLLALMLAAAWASRDRAAAAAGAVAVGVVLKAFLWPVALWLAVTGRVRALAVTVLAVAAVGIGGWAIIGFDGISSYPSLLDAVSETESQVSASVYALVLALGASPSAAVAATVAAALVLLVLAARAGSSRRGRADAEALALTVCAALVATPLLWPHHLTVLLVAVAVLRPALHPLWVLPVLMRLVQQGAGWPDGDLTRILPSLFVVAAVAVVAAGVGLRPAAARAGAAIPARGEPARHGSGAGAPVQSRRWRSRASGS